MDEEVKLPMPPLEQDPVEEPVAEPVPEPVPEPVAEPVAEPVPEPVAEPVPEPVAEPVLEPPQPVEATRESEPAPETPHKSFFQRFLGNAKKYVRY